MRPDPEVLNSCFSIPEALSFFEDQGGLVSARLTSGGDTATICLMGAHGLSYVPKEQQDIFWISSKSAYEEGFPIRGGVPVCFPWFGPHPENQAMPSHGFARLCYWAVERACTNEDGSVSLALQLDSSEHTRTLWPHDFHCSMTFTLGKALQVSLEIQNAGSELFELTMGLHPYFRVGRIDTVSIRGLHDHHYFDRGAGAPDKHATNDLMLSGGETYWFFNTSPDACHIDDPVMRRSITITKTGCRSLLVWNPGETKCASIPDMSANDFRETLCVEAVFNSDNPVTLRPGDTFSFNCSYSATIRD